MVVTVLAAITGAIAGGMLWVPLGVITPFWIVWTLPLLFGAAFASSLAYLVAGPAKAALSRTMGLSAIVASVCGAVNLIVGTSPWTPIFDYMMPPGGQKTLFVEALAIGAVAGLVLFRGGGDRRWRWTPLCVALLFSALAVANILFVGEAMWEAHTADWSVPGDRN